MAKTPFMMSRRALGVSMGAVLLLGCPKQGMAGPSKRMAVTIKVVDPSGEPVPTASVRHPEERDRHGVNMATGEYTTDALFWKRPRLHSWFELCSYETPCAQAAARIEEALQAIDYWPSISVDVPTNKLRRNMRKDI